MNEHYWPQSSSAALHAIEPAPEFMKEKVGRHDRDPVVSRWNSGQTGLLVLKFALTNLVAFALVAAAWMQGWIAIILAADQTGLTLVIVGTFLAGLLLCGHKIWLVNCELGCIRSYDPCTESWAAEYLAQVAGRRAENRTISGSALRVRITGWIAPVRHFANSLVLLGLIGTVVGFVIALSGIDGKAASDVSAISPMVSNLLGGMSVALYTTLVGSVLNLWLMVNHHLLAAGVQELFLGLIELGEENARN
jgi:hypothetical protein